MRGSENVEDLTLRHQVQKMVIFTMSPCMSKVASEADFFTV